MKAAPPPVKIVPRILIIDDTPANLGVVVEALEHHGHRVLIAQDGEEGVVRAGLVCPDLILLDVMMPGTDGFEVCRRLKLEPATRDIPVIFMTALSDMSDKVRGFQAGGVDYITKPFHLEEVLARVGTHLRLRDMQQQLATRNAELQRYRGHLEQLVAERTSALRESNEKLRLKSFALNQVREAAFLVDRDGNILYVNREACRSLGYGEEELLGMTVADIDPAWPRERSQAAWALLREPGVHIIETQHRRKDGSLFPVEVSGGLMDYEGREFNLALVRDITERKEAERKLLDSELKFRTMVENTPDNIARYDRVGRTIYLNPVLERTLGVAAETRLGTTIRGANPDGRFDDYADLVDKVLAEGTCGDVEIAWGDAEDGTREIHHIRVVPECDDRGTLIGALAIGRNITAHKEALERLHASEQAFRALVEHSPDAIARYDLECRRIYMNPAMLELCGRPPAELLGRTPAEKSPVADVPAFVAALRRVIESGVEHDEELLVRAATGELRWRRARMVPEFGPRGEVVSVLVVGHDVHELKESEQRFRTLAENLPDVVIRYDRAGRRMYVNPAYVRFNDTTPEQVLGKTPLEFSTTLTPVAQDFTHRLLDAMQAAQATEFDLSWSAGARDLNMYVRVVPERDVQGKVVSALTIWNDISGRKEAERRLRESYALLQELASRRETAREEERKRIAREIHDELGQHLTALRMGVSTLRFQFGRDNPALAARVQGLIELADKTIQVVRDVAATLRPAILDAGICSAIEWLTAEFERHSGIGCRLELPAADPGFDDERAMALFRIIQESLTNIARHADARQVDVVLQDRGGECLLEIRDYGRGFVPADVRKSAFGLVGMRERALMLGGEIAIDSVPEGGTTIRVTIPTHDKEASQ